VPCAAVWHVAAIVAAHKHDSNAPDAALRTDLVALHNQADALHQRLMDLTALSADEANKLRTEISAIHAAKIINKVERHAARARNIKYFLPDSMAEDNVSQSLANFLVHHTAKTIKQVTAKGAKHAEDRAKWEALMATDRSMADAAVREHLHKLAGMPFFMTSTDAQRVDDAINKVVSNTKPDSMSTNNILGRNDFEKFFAAFISPTGKNAHRFVQYESYYFGGNFVDRFGNALPKPTLSLNITDQDISGTLTVFLEALADTIFDTPVWASSTAYTYTNQTNSPMSAADMAKGLQQKMANSPPSGIKVQSVAGSSFTLVAATPGTAFKSTAGPGVQFTGSGTIMDTTTTPNGDGSNGTAKVAQVDTITLGAAAATQSTPFKPGDSVIEYIYGSTYYPPNTADTGTTNASKAVPSWVAYGAAENLPFSSLVAPIPTYQDSGCGMTSIKSDTLSYLSGKATTWAAGSTELFLGLFGGANVGPFVVFGKLSIGDNKALQNIVQTILSFASKRATYEALVPILWSIDIPSSTVADMVDQLVFDAPSSSSKTQTPAATPAAAGAAPADAAKPKADATNQK